MHPLPSRFLGIQQVAWKESLWLRLPPWVVKVTINKLGVLIHSISLAHASQRPLNQHIWISCRRGMCFGTVGPCMHNVWKVWGGQSVRTTLKEFRGCECSFEPHRTRGYGCFSRRPCALFASQGAAALSHIHHSRSELHGVVAAFALSSFPFLR